MARVTLRGAMRGERWHGIAASLLVTICVAAGAGSFGPPQPETTTAAQSTDTPSTLPTVSATTTPTPRVIEIETSTPTASITPELRAQIPTPTATPRTTPTRAVATPTATTVPVPTSTPVLASISTSTPLPTPVQVAEAPEPTQAAGTRIRFTAEDWVGGYYRGDGLAYGRPWVAVYGAASAYPRAALGFTLDAAPADPAVFTVTGLDDEWADLNPIALDVNGQRVFTGPSPFVNWDGVGDGADAAWTTVPFTIPDGVLRAGANEIVMLNLSPAASFNAPPYVLLADAVLETGGRSGGRAPEEAPQETVVAQDASSSLTFAAEDWAGGYYQGSGLFYGRPWVAIYGAESAYPRATIRFRISGPVTGPATFTLTGLDDELAAPNPVAVEINGQVLFSGPSPFANWDGVGTGANAAWTQATFTIPPEMLREGRNEIAVANLSPSGNFNAPPYVLLSDATLDVPGAKLNRGGRDTPR